jgi:hypothetical protein
VDCVNNKKREYLKAKINEVEIHSKNKNIRELYRGINDFKKGYQPRTNIVKDEKGDLVTGCHSILTYLLTYLLTPWSRVLPEKLNRPELLKKFPPFYGTRRFITAFTRARYLSLS